MAVLSLIFSTHKAWYMAPHSAHWSGRQIQRSRSYLREVGDHCGIIHTPFLPSRLGSKKPSSWKNNALNYYFKPELEAAIIEDEHKYKSMSPNEFYKWVDERRAAATRMMQVCTALHRSHSTNISCDIGGHCPGPLVSGVALSRWALDEVWPIQLHV